MYLRREILGGAAGVALLGATGVGNPALGQTIRTFAAIADLKGATPTGAGERVQVDGYWWSGYGGGYYIYKGTATAPNDDDDKTCVVGGTSPYYKWEPEVAATTNTVPVTRFGAVDQANEGSVPQIIRDLMGMENALAFQRAINFVHRRALLGNTHQARVLVPNFSDTTGARTSYKIGNWAASGSNVFLRTGVEIAGQIRETTWPRPCLINGARGTGGYSLFVADGSPRIARFAKRTVGGVANTSVLILDMEPECLHDLINEGGQTIAASVVIRRATGDSRILPAGLTIGVSYRLRRVPGQPAWATLHNAPGNGTPIVFNAETYPDPPCPFYVVHPLSNIAVVGLDFDAMRAGVEVSSVAVNGTVTLATNAPSTLESGQFVQFFSAPGEDVMTTTGLLTQGGSVETQDENGYNYVWKRVSATQGILYLKRTEEGTVVETFTGSDSGTRVSLGSPLNYTTPSTRPRMYKSAVQAAIGLSGVLDQVKIEDIRISNHGSYAIKYGATTQSGNVAKYSNLTLRNIVVDGLPGRTDDDGSGIILFARAIDTDPNDPGYKMPLSTNLRLDNCYVDVSAEEAHPRYHGQQAFKLQGVDGLLYDDLTAIGSAGNAIIIMTGVRNVDKIPGRQGEIMVKKAAGGLQIRSGFKRHEPEDPANWPAAANWDSYDIVAKLRNIVIENYTYEKDGVLGPTKGLEVGGAADTITLRTLSVDSDIEVTYENKFYLSPSDDVETPVWQNRFEQQLAEYLGQTLSNVRIGTSAGGLTISDGGTVNIVAPCLPDDGPVGPMLAVQNLWVVFQGTGHVEPAPCERGVVGGNWQSLVQGNPPNCSNMPPPDCDCPRGDPPPVCSPPPP